MATTAPVTTSGKPEMVKAPMTFDRDLVEKYGNDEKKLAELQAIRTKFHFACGD